MPVIFMKGGKRDAQGLGAGRVALQSQIYAIPQINPTQLRFLGGHFIPEAPEYTDTDAVTINEPYIDAQGFNRVRTKVVLPVGMSEMSFTLIPPMMYKTAADVVRQEQRRTNTTHHFAFLSSDECADPCDRNWEIAANATVGERRDTGGRVVSAGGDETPDTAGVPTEMVVTTPHNYQKYDGLQLSEIAPFTSAIRFAIENVSCNNSLCPWMDWYMGGEGAYLAMTDNKFGTRTVIDTTTIAADITGEDASAIITSGIQLGNKLVVGYTSNSDDDGGVAYSVNNGATVLSTMDVPSTGINALLEAFGRIWAFGNDGQVYYSCDEGVTFTLLTGTGITQDILSVAYSRNKTLAYVGASGGKAFVFDGSSFVDISDKVGLVISQSVTAVATNDDDIVAFGTSNGIMYESFNASRRNNADWVVGGTFTGPIHFIGIDPFGLRTIVTAGSTWHLREVPTEQRWESRDTLVNPIIAGAIGEVQENEGLNFAVIFTDNGEAASIEGCFPCNTEGC